MAPAIDECWRVGAIRAYFNERASRYTAGNWQSHVTDEERQAVQDVPGPVEVAVDLGSGPGVSVAALQERASTVIMVDCSSEMLRLAPSGLGVRAVIADAHELPFSDGSVDLVHARMVLHYLDIPRAKLELSRVLSPRGRLLVISAFPYTAEDAEWFNARHAHKRKPIAHTPPIQALVAALASHFVLERCVRWTRTSFLSRTIASAGCDTAADLRSHMENAPATVRTRYGITRTPDGDVTSRVLWGALTFRKQ